MNIFKRNDKLEVQLELESKIEQLELDNDSLKKELTEARHTISSFVDVKSSYDDSKEKLVKKYEKQIDQLNQMLLAEKQSVAAKVNAELSSIGVNKFLAEEISSTETPVDDEAIFNKWVSMKDTPEKHEFFHKNEKVIDRFSKGKQ